MAEAPATWGEALRAAAASLRRAGVEVPARDALLLLAAATGRRREALIAAPATVLDKAEAAAFGAMVARRAAREPVSRILGRREFWSLEIEIDASVLDPRPDSETVVAAALGLAAETGAPQRLLDLGTGSGCLLLALLTELPEAFGVGVDRCPRAVACAERNARRLGLAGRARFAVGEWGAALAGPYDLIVANPPYVADGDIDRLAPEVWRYEPRRALAGGADGLAAYRALAPALPALLAPTGTALLEIGADQREAVSMALGAAGLAVVACRRDLAGRPRCLVARLSDGTVKEKKGLAYESARTRV